MAAIYRANPLEAQGYNRPKPITNLQRHQIGQALDYGHLDAFGVPMLQSKAYKDAQEFLKAEKDYRERERFLDRITPSRRAGTAISVGTSTSTSGLPIPDQTGYVYNYPAEVTAQTGLQFQAPSGGKEVPEEKLNLNTKNVNPVIQTREMEIRVDPMDGTHRVGVATGVVDRSPKFPRRKETMLCPERSLAERLKFPWRYQNATFVSVPAPTPHAEFRKYEPPPVPVFNQGKKRAGSSTLYTAQDKKKARVIWDDIGARRRLAAVGRDDDPPKVPVPQPTPPDFPTLPKAVDLTVEVPRGTKRKAKRSPEAL
ncbi:uncharacterized protein EV422DRAFT_564992 [Fimicolochytrium jonesii]|uniref:uncharacterized protein n=1 Tax=Fimicolochytrium jonesii TaxID=1396493 RepID=UPI0022FDF584|nr:uncharacterized protein EV422DRAFT_564992 [Fimicolochytrium jonesii]KAI8824294.1 hypothetical protein EV422DRAFT_564992 [Fimicolochytrium jonesii]